METIFLSYVRQDEEQIARLAADLTRQGAEVWRDRTSIEPGVPWEDAIRHAIINGTYFVPCFSTHYTQRSATYMDEELHVACTHVGADAVHAKYWLIPVNLDGSIVPSFTDERRIINDVQHVEMYPSWEDGVRRLSEATVQITKKRTMERIDCVAAELGALDVRLFKADKEFEQARFEQIRQTTAERARSMMTGSQPGYHPPDTLRIPADLSGYQERVAAAAAKLAEKRTEYAAGVREFLARYDEEYDPFYETVPELNREKARIDERMRVQAKDNEQFARQVLIAIIVIIGLVTALAIALG